MKPTITIYTIFGLTLLVHQVIDVERSQMFFVQIVTLLASKFVLSHFQINGKSVEDDVETPKPKPLPSIPSLPTGSITGNTVDCVNVSDYPI